MRISVCVIQIFGYFPLVSFNRAIKGTYDNLKSNLKKSGKTFLT